MAQKKQGNEKKSGVKIQDLSPKKDAKGGRAAAQGVQLSRPSMAQGTNTAQGANTSQGSNTAQ